MRITKQKQTASAHEKLRLTREHHDGLLLSWKINNGLKKDISLDRIKAYVLYYFYNFIDPHFQEEEDFIYPLIAADNPDRRKAELQHEGVRVRIEYLERNYQLSEEFLKGFAEFLTEHIYFEEKELFNVIENNADPRALLTVVIRTKRILKIDNDWPDQFWLK